MKTKKKALSQVQAIHLTKVILQILLRIQVLILEKNEEGRNPKGRHLRIRNKKSSTKIIGTEVKKKVRKIKQRIKISAVKAVIKVEIKANKESLNKEDQKIEEI